MNEKWHKRFIELAKHISTWSRDPSTQVGAVIIGPNRIIRGLGYNGFPRGVVDAENRYDNRLIKYKMVVHAEVNAILNSNGPVRDCTLYLWPLPPCAECAKLIIQSGIKNVFFPVFDESKFQQKWQEEYEYTRTMFSEAGVEYTALPTE